MEQRKEVSEWKAMKQVEVMKQAEVVETELSNNAGKREPSLPLPELSIVKRIGLLFSVIAVCLSRSHPVSISPALPAD